MRGALHAIMWAHIDLSYMVNKMRRIAFLVLFSVSIAACLPAGDAAFKVKGRFIDADHRPYTNCTLTVKYSGNVLEEIAVPSEFKETVVFHPSGRDPVIVYGSCLGANDKYERKIDKIPKNFEEYIDLGEIVLQRGKGVRSCTAT